MARSTRIPGLLMGAALALGIALAMPGCEPRDQGGHRKNDGSQCGYFRGDGCKPGDTMEIECPDPDSGADTTETVECLLEDEGCETYWEEIDCDTPLVL